jgi:hypothetical protein
MIKYLNVLLALLTEKSTSITASTRIQRKVTKEVEGMFGTRTMHSSSLTISKLGCIHIKKMVEDDVEDQRTQPLSFIRRLSEVSRGRRYSRQGSRKGTLKFKRFVEPKARFNRRGSDRGATLGRPGKFNLIKHTKRQPQILIAVIQVIRDDG